MKDRKRQRGATSAGPKLRAQRSTLNAQSSLPPNNRKQAEQAKNLAIEDLNRSHQYFRALFNWTPSAVGISTVAEGLMCDVNEGFSRLTGYTREELIGRTTLELGLWADLSQREIVLREIREQGFVHNREGLLRTKSGEIRSLMVTVESIQLGSTPCLIYLAHDITERKRAEQQLRRSEQELADFFENATVGLHWVGPDGIILRANRAELNLLGYAADEYVGHHIAEFHADQGVIDDILRRLTVGEELHNYEARLRCKDGSVRHVLISSNVLWEDGRFVHTRCFTRDITERKQAEEALRKSEERFGSFVRSIDDGIVTLDRLGLIISWNPGAEKLFGYAQDEVLGKPMTLLMPERFRERHERGIERASAAGHLTAAGSMFELVGLRKDGTEFPTELSLSSWSTRNEVFFTGIVRDITKRKQAEKILGESEERFRSLVGVITDVPWTADPKGQFVTPQEAYSRYTGASWEELRGRGWAQYIHPDDREQLVRAWKHAVATRTKYKAACREWHGPTQQWRHVIARGTPVLNPDGSVREWVGSLTDVNEQYEVEAALRESEEKYRTIFNSIDEGFCIAEVLYVDDRQAVDHRIIEANPAFEKHTGLKNPVGRLASELMPGVEQFWNDIYARVVATGESYQSERYSPAFGCWFEVEVSRVGDESDRRVAIVFRDTTERKVAEETLRTSEERLRKIFECSNDAIFVVDPERDLICQANPKACEMFGYGPDEILATPISRFHPRDLAEFQKFFQRVFEEGRGWTNEFPCRTKDGRFVTSEISASTLLLDGRACILTIVRDITERKQAEALLSAEKKVFGLIATGAVMPDVLDTLMREIEAQSTDGMLCSVLLVDETGQRLLHGAAPSLPEAYNMAAHGLVIGPSAGSCGTAAFERKPVSVTDIAADPRWAGGKDLAAAHGLGACHSTPILSSQGRLLGTIAMYYRRPHNPGAHDRQLIERATQLAGIAIERRQAEEALRLAKFSMDRAADAVYWIDPQAKVLDVNEAASLMLGYSKDELCAMTVHDLNPEFQADMWPGYWEETKKRGTMVIETCHKAKNGRLIPIEVSVNFLSYEGKEYHCAFVRNITERKQAEAALIHSRNLLQSVIQTSPIRVFWKDRESRYLGCNQIFAKDAGETTPEHVIGMMDYDLAWKEQAELYRANDRLVIESGLPKLDFEEPQTTPEGKLIWLRTWKVPLRDEMNQVIGVLGIYEDITERKRMEAALRESEDRYRSIFEKAVDGIFQTTLDGAYVAVNPALARIYGYDSPDDMIATITDIAGQLYVTPGQRDVFLGLMHAQEEVSGFEALVYRKDGSMIWISESARTLRDRAGTVVGYEGTVEDITERKRAEGRLRVTLDQVRALSGRVATVQEEERTRIARELHDELGVKLTCLKIDLSRVMSLVGNRVRADLRAELNDRVRSMVEQVDSTIASVQQLVTQLRPALLDDLGLVAAIEWHSRDFQKRTGISCACVTSMDEIAMDPERAMALFRICQEALTNTARHAQATAVTITVTSQQDSLQLVVADNGVGIPDAKASDRQSLGLMGMQERAAHCGGTVTIEGRPDKGTTVTVCLPVGGEQPEP